MIHELENVIWILPNKGAQIILPAKDAKTQESHAVNGCFHAKSLPVSFRTLNIHRII